MSRATDRCYRMLGRTLVGFGGFALVVGVWSGWTSWAATRDAVQVWGVVVDLARREPSMADRPGEGHIGRAPVVEYKAGGGTYRVRGRVYAHPASYDVGDSVVVRHPPGRPGEGRIDSFSERWMGPLLFGGGGLLFVVLGLGVLRHTPPAHPSEP